MDIEIITEGLQFPEAPVVCDDGSYLVVEQPPGKVTRVAGDGRKYELADCGGAPNGLAFGPDGAIYCVNSGGWEWAGMPGHDWLIPVGNPAGYTSGWVERIDPATGRSERLYDACDGIPLAAPNDIVIDAKGDIWFTDLGRDMGDHLRHGGLYHARTDGSSIRRVVHALGLNGVGLSPDGKTVYAAETLMRLILAFPADCVEGDAQMPGPVPAILGRGTFSGRTVTSFPAGQLLDSLAIEAGGTIAQAIVAGGTGIGRVNPETGATEHVPLPDPYPTNIAFGGEDMREAIVTLSGKGCLARLSWPAQGLKLAFGGH